MQKYFGDIFEPIDTLSRLDSDKLEEFTLTLLGESLEFSYNKGH
jgi:hypothetical protein